MLAQSGFLFFKFNTKEGKGIPFRFHGQVITTIHKLPNISLNELPIWTQPYLVITIVQDHKLMLVVDE